MLLLLGQILLRLDPLWCPILHIRLDLATKRLSDICYHGLTVEDAVNGAVLFCSKRIQFVQFLEGFLAWGRGVFGVGIAWSCLRLGLGGGFILFGSLRGFFAAAGGVS